MRPIYLVVGRSLFVGVMWGVACGAATESIGFGLAIGSLGALVVAAVTIWGLLTSKP